MEKMVLTLFVVSRKLEALLLVFSYRHANGACSKKHYRESIGYGADSKVSYEVETL